MNLQFVVLTIQINDITCNRSFAPIPLVCFSHSPSSEVMLHKLLYSFQLIINFLKNLVQRKSVLQNTLDLFKCFCSKHIYNAHDTRMVLCFRLKIKTMKSLLLWELKSSYGSVCKPHDFFNGQQGTLQSAPITSTRGSAAKIYAKRVSDRPFLIGSKPVQVIDATR